MPDKVLLKTLELGDRFIAASRYHKRFPVYEVIGKPEFSARHGSSVRECRNLQTLSRESKSCRLEVIKLER